MGASSGSHRYDFTRVLYDANEKSSTELKLPAADVVLLSAIVDLMKCSA
jgi:hypothetical protein